MSDERYACGPQWWPKIIRRALSGRFGPACVEHDRDYAAGVPRSLADRRFRRHLLSLAAGSRWWSFWAHLFGCGVTLFGWLFKRARWMR